MWVELSYCISFIVTWVILLYASLLLLGLSYCTRIIVTRVILLYYFRCNLPWTHALYKYCYTRTTARDWRLSQSEALILSNADTQRKSDIWRSHHDLKTHWFVYISSNFEQLFYLFLRTEWMNSCFWFTPTNLFQKILQ